MSTLIMFDINGTLIKRDSRTDIPYEEAVNEFFDITNGMDGVNTSARSDKDVFIEVLKKNNQKFSEDNWQKFLKLYIHQLEKFKDTDVWRENDTAVDFVEKLFKQGYPLVLISGELSIGAKYKLEKIGIWKYFKTGGFGEDGLIRSEIAETALRKAKSTFNDNFDQIYIIGDTILDITTARHLNAKVISITTGSNTREELEKYNPDLIINRFDELVKLP